jgi:hypothetical protein
MARIQVNTRQVAAALRAAATALKAAVAVSAAAILSQAKADLDANAAAAVDHLDAFCGKLHALHEAILRDSGNAAALAVISSAGTAEIDVGAVAARLATVDDLIERSKAALFAVVGSAKRDGIDVFAERVGALGRAFQDTALAAGDQAITATPFRFDQFFLETMHDLGQRDWSDTGTGP